MNKQMYLVSLGFIKVFALMGCLVSKPAFSHGYVNNPESRSFFCNQGGNANCGSVQFEPQSVEGADGFPASGAVDGQIAAAGQASWSLLNEQTANRWKKRVIKSGGNSFSWHFTAPHVTKDFRYYITKSDWNPDQPLSRDAFDLNPFCVVDGGMIKPPFDITHDCNVPNRKGYHVILSLWDVGDTAATFYQVIDVEINGVGAVVPGNGGNGNKPPVEPGPGTPDKSNPGAGNPACKVPNVGKKICTALPGAAANNQWCNLNCNHDPSFCPIDLCSCIEDEDGASLKPGKPPVGAKPKVCEAVLGSFADAQWCNINCNHNPSFCPADFCSCL